MLYFLYFYDLFNSPSLFIKYIPTYNLVSPSYMIQTKARQPIHVQHRQNGRLTSKTLLKMQTSNLFNGIVLSQQGDFFLGELRKVKSWSVLNLALINSLKINEEIPGTIKHIEFSHLVYLNISGNHINSIEQLYYLYAPNLQKLSLSFNQISSISCLKKLSSFSLSYLSINENYILDCPALHQFNLTDLNSLIIEQKKYSSLQFDNMHGLARLSRNQSLIVNARSTTRIHLKSFKKSLKAKEYGILTKYSNSNPKQHRKNRQLLFKSAV